MTTRRRWKQIQMFLQHRTSAPCIIRTRQHRRPNVNAVRLGHEEHGNRLIFEHPLPISMTSVHGSRTTLAFSAITSVCMINTAMVLKGDGFEIEIPPAIPAGRLTIHTSTPRRSIA